MRHRILIMVVLALLLVAGCSERSELQGNERTLEIIEHIYANDPAKQNVGRIIEGYTFTDVVSGETFSVTDLYAEGKYVIFESYFVDCPSCVEIILDYKDFYEDYADEVEIVLIDMEPSEDAEYILELKEELGAQDWKWIIYNDDVGRFIEDYKIYGPDATYLVDTTGEVRYADSLLAHSRLQQAVDDLLEGELTWV